MPGAYLKGNSSFPGMSFIVDEISRPWNSFGVASATLIDQLNIFKHVSMEVTYYKLDHIVFMNISAVIIPSTIPYTGEEDSTDYLYIGSVHLPSNMPCSMHVDIEPYLSASAFHFQNNINVINKKAETYIDVTEKQIIGTMHIDGNTNKSRLVLTVPSGFFPNHTYTITGSLVYECLE